MLAKTNESYDSNSVAIPIAQDNEKLQRRPSTKSSQRPQSGLRRQSSQKRPQSSQSLSVIVNKVVVEIEVDDGFTDDHFLPLEEFVTKFETDTKRGLSTQQVTKRRARDGLNKLTPIKGTPLIIQFIQELYRGFGIILWIACLLCFLAWKPLGDPPSFYNLALAIVIIVVVLFQAIFTFIQNQHSSNIIAKFQKMVPKRCMVLRDSNWQEIDVSFVAVGDIIKIMAGEQFPADMRIIECSQAKEERASLTGESEPISLTTHATDKNPLETKNLAFFGTYLIEGNCTGIVTNIGDSTVMGKIAKFTAKAEQPQTSLQKEINYFVIIIAFLAFTTVAILLIIWGAWLRQDYPTFLPTASMIVNCLGVLVAFIPEGLPIAVTMTLTLVARRMFKVKLMVKKLGVIETLGSSTVIASDKTGTITQNKMSLSHVWFPQENPDLQNTSIDMLNGKIYPLHEQALCILKLATLCNNAKRSKNPTDAGGEKEFIGSFTDIGLLRSAVKFIDIEKMRKDLPVAAELPFNSRYKCQMTIHKTRDLNDFMHGAKWDEILGTQNPSHIKILKGAPEVILQYCSSVIVQNKIVENSQEWNERALDACEKLARQGERVIGFAFELLPQGEVLKAAELGEKTPHLKNFAFAGFASLIDPPKEGVSRAVDECHDAGIKVIMVTGDHPSTAVAIAKMVHIVDKQNVSVFDQKNVAQWKGGAILENEEKTKVALSKFQNWFLNIKKNFVTTIYEKSKVPAIDAAIVITGQDIPKFDKKSWTFVLAHKQIVFARTTPEHKSTIVQELQRVGEIVAVTGDGVNDAPALKFSDIGVAMGSGSDISKEAANVIALNDSFETIVNGIKEGRLLYDNLRKVVSYLLPAGSFSEILPVLANVILGLPLALSAFQMIVICVGTDLCGSLGLVHEDPESGLMKRKPRDAKNDRLMSLKLIFYAYFQVGLIQSIIAFFMFFLTLYKHGVHPNDAWLAYGNWGTDGYLGFTEDEQTDILNKGQTAYFVALVMCQLWNLQCARTRRESLFRSKFRPSLFLYMIGEVAIACFVCYVPFMNTYLDTAPADWYHFIYPALMGAFLVIVEEIRKYFLRKYPEGFLAKIAW